MDWTRISVGLLTEGLSDQELVAITKYQLLWAHMEREPNERVALRYLTKKQLETALRYRESISKIVIQDVMKVVSKRNREKSYYHKNKDSDIFPRIDTDSETTHHIREDDSKGENNKQKNNIYENTKLEIKTENDSLGKTGFRGIPLPKTGI